MNRRERKLLAKKMRMGSHNITVKIPPVSYPMLRMVDVGRNTPCPCGSGKKYKYCCLMGGKFEQYIDENRKKEFIESLNNIEENGRSVNANVN